MNGPRQLVEVGTIFLLIAGVVGIAGFIDSGRTREISGLWLLQFEGSNFFEGATPATVRGYGLEDAGWLNTSDQIDLSNLLPRYDGNDNCWKVKAIQMRFRGHRQFGLSGHLGMWNSSYEIEELLEMEEVPWPECDSPFDWNDAEG